MSTPSIRLGAVSFDADDHKALATFYQELLGLELLFESDAFVALAGASTLITTQHVEDHRPPDWPTGPTPKQVHVELAVDDLDAAEALAVSLGAHAAEVQPGPDRWRVMIDPAGHPFCFSTLIPDI